MSAEAKDVVAKLLTVGHGFRSGVISRHFFDRNYRDISAEAKDAVAKLLTVRGCLISCMLQQLSVSVSKPAVT